MLGDVARAEPEHVAACLAKIRRSLKGRRSTDAETIAPKSETIGPDHETGPKDHEPIPPSAIRGDET
jgi:hypothetical protein